MDSLLPKIIWQTYKSEAELPPQSRRGIASWKLLNPEWDYRFCSDAEILQFFQEHYPAEVVEIFEKLPLGVMKADFWRYAVLYEFGGIYSDIDTICQFPIRRWLPVDNREMLHVACEGGHPYFCQWTIAATPRHPVLSKVIDLVVARITQDGGVNEAMPHYVHYYTGPGLWTAAIQSFLGTDSLPCKLMFNREKWMEKAITIYDYRFFSQYPVQHQNASKNWRQLHNNYESWLDARKDKVL